jgi:hypothetical protein
MPMIPALRSLRRRRRLAQSPEARRVLPDYERAARPADRQQVRAWLLRLVPAVRNAPAQLELEAQAGLVCLACSDLPAGVFSAEALMTALRDERCRFWPSVADIHDILEPLARPMLETLAGLRRLAATDATDPSVRAQAESERGAPTAAEREHVRRVAAQARAELTASAARAATSRSAVAGKAAHLSDGALLAAYQTMGEAGAIRARTLRAKIARAVDGSAWTWRGRLPHLRRGAQHPPRHATPSVSLARA